MRFKKTLIPFSYPNSTDKYMYLLIIIKYHPSVLFFHPFFSRISGVRGMGSMLRHNTPHGHLSFEMGLRPILPSFSLYRGVERTSDTFPIVPCSNEQFSLTVCSLTELDVFEGEGAVHLLPPSVYGSVVPRRSSLPS